MKKRTLMLSVVFAAIAAMSFMNHAGHENHKTLEIGAEAPLTDKMMMDVSGEELSLNNLKLENGLCVIFSCNTCPFVVGSAGSAGWEGRYNTITKDCAQYKVGMVLVNSNEARRNEGDSMDDMKS